MHQQCRTDQYVMNLEQFSKDSVKTQELAILNLAETVQSISRKRASSNVPPAPYMLISTASKAGNEDYIWFIWSDVVLRRSGGVSDCCVFWFVFCITGWSLKFLNLVTNCNAPAMHVHGTWKRACLPLCLY